MTSGSSSGRWRRIAELLGEALEREPSARERFLDEACAGDADLRREVASLLEAHDRQGAVDRLAGDVAPLAARAIEAAAERASSTRGTAAPLVGQTVGKYRVLERVGGGGMGIVYKAIDTKLDRTVALKFLQSRLGTDDSAAERFRLEARAVAALEHPNVCTLHEIGETEDGQLYLTMPLYEGETLQQRIARGPLPVGEAVGIATQIARGLAKAHARGIVHRDIKPSNVLVTSDGVVKVLDFGIAKLADVTLTGAAGPLGTVAYMSPEQLQGARVDHRTDLWSLGVVLYEMLTGRHPFLTGGAGAVWDAILQADPAPVSSLRAEVPPALERVVTTALAKEPDARFPEAQAFEAELLALERDPQTPGDAVSVSRTAPPASRRWVTRGAIGLPVLGAIVAALWLGPGRALWSGAARGAVTIDSTSMPRTIAVLPFVNGSGSEDDEYFSDGITDELIATLARIEGLKVASRTSSFAFKGRNVDIRTIGEQLGVAAVLEGNVRRAGARLRIDARLVSAADGYPLWGETYNRDAGDAFAVQAEIARAIAQRLEVRLAGPTADEGSAGAPSPEAWELYLKARQALYLRGRYAWYTRTEEGLRTAASFFEQAVAQAPDYARAHSGLADAYAVLGFYDYLAPSEAFTKARTAAERAKSLDPTLAEPHATLGYVALYYDWSFARAEEEFQRAIALAPNYSTAHQWYGNLLAAAGRFDEAERAMRRASELDPLSLIAQAALGWVFYMGGDYAAAVTQCRQTLDLNADYAVAHLWSGWALQEMDSLEAAVAAHQRAVAVTDSSTLYVASLARSLALAGNRGEAERLLRRLEAQESAGRYVPPYELSKVYDALGRTDDALAALERALAQRSHSMVFLRVDPQLARLRSHPRFARLVAQVFR